jgi:hypothetical protein
MRMKAIARRLLGAAAPALLTGAFAATAFAQETFVSAQRSPNAAPARPGEIAVREEFEAARRTGTIAAYDLFIARHPDSALAETARAERERLAREAAPQGAGKP